MRVSVVQGDITAQDVDAVVNAANNAMRGGGGVDGAIHRAGGPAVLADCVRRFPHGLATGDAGWTTAGELAARWVIHVVGPIHGRGTRDQLLSCYRRALEVADEVGARTVAFPLVSAGVYGWPQDDAIACALESFAAYDGGGGDGVGDGVGDDGGVTEARLMAFDGPTYDRIAARLVSPAGRRPSRRSG